jgi:hypothetical protein
MDQRLHLFDALFVGLAEDPVHGAFEKICHRCNTFSVNDSLF